jgi:hypothetical protein
MAWIKRNHCERCNHVRLGVRQPLTRPPAILTNDDRGDQAEEERGVGYPEGVHITALVPPVFLLPLRTQMSKARFLFIGRGFNGVGVVVIVPPHMSILIRKYLNESVHFGLQYLSGSVHSVLRLFGLVADV